MSRWRLLLGFGIVNGGFSLVSCGVVHIIRRRVMDWLRVVDPSLDVKMVRKGTPLKTQGYRLRERLERGVGLGGLGLGIRRAWRFFVSGRDRAGDGACSQEGNKKLSEHFLEWIVCGLQVEECVDGMMIEEEIRMKITREFAFVWFPASLLFSMLTIEKFTIAIFQAYT